MESNNTILSFQHIPDYWGRETKGIFNKKDEELLSSMRMRSREDLPDMILQFSYPIDFSTAYSTNGKPIKKIVHVTTEYEVTNDMKTLNSPDWSNPGDVMLMTPSKWSANILKDLGGVPENKIFVLPHGFDPTTFYPISNKTHKNECKKFRKKLGIPPESFVYLHISAGTPNKNIPFIADAFKRVRAKHPTAVLVLKTISALYQKHKWTENGIKAYSWADDELIWLDDELPNSRVALLYRCSNVYVSPYSSEGFNLPVLESMASGIPVIVTAGGSTDDFTHSSFARYISAEVIYRYPEGGSVPNVKRLHVSPESLYEEMLFVTDDYYKGDKSSWMSSAGKIAAETALANYTWEKIGDALLNYVLDK